MHGRSGGSKEKDGSRGGWTFRVTVRYQYATDNLHRAVCPLWIHQNKMPDALRRSFGRAGLRFGHIGLMEVSGSYNYVRYEAGRSAAFYTYLCCLQTAVNRY